MLEVQKYLLSGKTLDNLTSEFGIKVARHPVDPLVILNYDQIDSPKMHPIVRECRGLTLELDTWKVIAKAFDRFFNDGEALELTQDFVWEDSTALAKEDGSLILVYEYKSTLRVNTRGSFAEYNIHECGRTWADIFWEALGKDTLKSKIDIVHIFELCSSYNKVVRQYKKPTAYLLSIFNRETLKEYNDEFVNDVANFYTFERPQSYTFKNSDEVILFLQEKEASDPTFEGVVLKDINGMRKKVKSKTYVALHQMHGNDNIFLAKNLVPFILAGEIDEVLTYFPEVEPRMLEVKAIIDDAYNTLYCNWFHAQDFEEQKAFAIWVTKDSPFKTPFTGLIFYLRRDHGQYQDVKLLEAAWRNNADGILKHLF